MPPTMGAPRFLAGQDEHDAWPVSVYTAGSIVLLRAPVVVD
jgi:hypothetical protein